jgi:hypothetical protein
VNWLGRSYVTQGDRKIHDLPPLPPPATVVQRETWWDPDFPDSTSPGPSSSPFGRSGPHTANQNGGDLYPYDNETGQDCDM